MFVTLAPVTSPAPKPATLSGTVLPAVKAEVAAAAAATATPASRTRDLRIAGSCSLSGSVPRGWHPVEATAAPLVDALSSAAGNRLSTPVPKETGVAKATLQRRRPTGNYWRADQHVRRNVLHRIRPRWSRAPTTVDVQQHATPTAGRPRSPQ